MNVEELAFKLSIQRAAEEDDRTGRPAFAREVGSCRFDWVLGFRGRRLECVTGHKHRDKTVLILPGGSTLKDLHASNRLVGLALQDAERLARADSVVSVPSVPIADARG
jgi:hypothetical protein